MNINTINNKKVFIFDVDGTLYSQPKMRMRMAMKLAIHYSLHFFRYKELKAISTFRKIRETAEFKETTMEQQIEYAANRCKIDYSKAKTAIEKWMFVVPLDIMEKCAFKDLLGFINSFQKNGKELVIYSDYPADDKIKKLNLTPSMVFTPENPHIAHLKPSKKAMDYIISELPYELNDIIYIGDRDCKDRRSAEYAGIDYCDIKELLRLLKEAK